MGPRGTGNACGFTKHERMLASGGGGGGGGVSGREEGAGRLKQGMSCRPAEGSVNQVGAERFHSKSKSYW